MRATKRWFLFAQIALLSPALLFLTAVGIQMLHPIRPAERIVMLYAGRMWTLWVLLIALPLMVLASGIALRQYRRPESEDPRWMTPLSRATTAAAGVILVIVALHMGAT